MGYPKRRLIHSVVLFAGLVVLAILGRELFSGKVSASSIGPSFVEFESGQVRPIAISPDGNTLFAVNTPNGTLEVFGVLSVSLRDGS
jgi:hypothetical protein